jgi:hypothetical protein
MCKFFYDLRNNELDINDLNVFLKAIAADIILKTISFHFV